MKLNVQNKKLPIWRFIKQPWVLQVAIIVVTGGIALATDRGWAALSAALSIISDILTTIGNAIPI